MQCYLSKIKSVTFLEISTTYISSKHYIWLSESRLGRIISEIFKGLGLYQELAFCHQKDDTYWCMVAASSVCKILVAVQS